MVNIREFLFRVWYWYVNRIDRKGEIQFMNFGFSDSKEILPLEPYDEPNRYSIQLYHHLANHINLEGKDIHEVGCGRGGGLSYIFRNFSPASAKGIDLNGRAIRFCTKRYAQKGLSFVQGDAQNLPIESSSCDVLLNVESSHRYPKIDSFFDEVNRVLRPGGHFLFTDFRYDYEMKDLREQLERTGLTVVSEKIITKEVVNALQLDDARRKKLIATLTPRYLHKLALNFAGTIGSETYSQFASRRYEYFSFVLRKN